MKNIKLIALDIDGVLLEDTFSPILKNLALKLGLEYTRELERSLFSRPREEASKYVLNLLNLSETQVPELLKTYFIEREKYLKENNSGLIAGVPEFLEFMSSLDVKLVCYGGLKEDEIIEEFKPYLKYFDQYVCTNDFRPGIKEITKDIYNLSYNEILFVDDVNTVAEVAASNNVPFIGVPSDFSWGFQKSDMIHTGVKHIVKSVAEINSDLLNQIDQEITLGSLW